VPPLIGYSAAGGAVTDTIIMLFALFMFLWQMPHFWLLLVRYGTDYEKAGIKTFYGAMSPDRINYMVLIWITGSSLLLWILLGIFMSIALPVAVILLVLNIAFIIAFRMIIRKSEVRSGNAFILINSFSLLIMIILIAAS
jgi:protoheme IX farnesyltransferase